MVSALAKSMFLQVGSHRYQVASFEQASQMFCTTRDAALARLVEPSKICGQPIVDEHGTIIAHVSYNGRVWPGAEYLPDATPLYDNRVS